MPTNTVSTTAYRETDSAIPSVFFTRPSHKDCKDRPGFVCHHQHHLLLYPSILNQSVRVTAGRLSRLHSDTHL